MVLSFSKANVPRKSGLQINGNVKV